MILKVQNVSNIGKIVKTPPSKSYTHRSVIISSLAEGISRLYDLFSSEDSLSSVNTCKIFGATIDTSISTFL